MRYIIVFCLATLFLLGFDPPAYLSDGDDQEFKRLNTAYASVPVCFGDATFRLGDDISSVTQFAETGARLSESNDYTYLSWKEYNSAAGCDTFVRCTFKSDVLVAFSSVTLLDKQEGDKRKALNTLQSQFNCIERIRPVLEFGGNLSYLEEDLSHIQEFRLTTQAEKYSGLFYEVRYPEVPSYFNQKSSNS